MSAAEVLYLVVAVVVVAVVAALVLHAVRGRRSARLRQQFGPEYERTVQAAGGRRDAERDLRERQDERRRLVLRPLPPASRERYLAAWDGVQTRFVDSPVLALSEADALLTRLMGERGFPTADERSTERVLSAQDAQALEAFRAGHAIEQANTTGNADTEQVRQGMLHFREVFQAVIGDAAQEPYPGRDGGQREPGRTPG